MHKKVGSVVFIVLIGFLFIGLAVVGITSDVSAEVRGESFPSVHYKSCTYVWDSTSYLNQEVSIAAGISDVEKNQASDSVTVTVLDEVLGGGGGAHSMSGDMLEIQIIEPSGNVEAGDVEIRISAAGPDELGPVSLSIESSSKKGGGGFGFIIPDSLCTSSSGGGGGGGPGR